MFDRLAPLLKLAAAICVALLLVDAALFRSGIYAYLTKPDSNAGSVVVARMVIDASTRSERRNVLVLGNSQIGEGFSARTADATVPDRALHFINGSAPGTTPRVWDYLLREVDPSATRFAAVAMMVDYDVSYEFADFTNYPLDPGYAASLLRLSDIGEFPASFDDAAQVVRARRAILLPLQAQHDDVLDMLLHPVRRLHDIRKYRPRLIADIESYAGRSGSLPALALDEAARGDAHQGASQAPPGLAEYFRDARKEASVTLRAANIAYERRWIGSIAARYAKHGVPVIVFNMARGPWKAQLLPPPQPNAALTELRDAGSVVLLPGDAFVGLERPEFFFDTLHLNAAGRDAFSRQFATQVAAVVH